MSLISSTPTRRQALGATLGLAASALPMFGLAKTDYIENTHFKKLIPPQPVSVQRKQVEVLEFFSYSCSHCFHLEKRLEAWLAKKPAHVVFRRIHVGFRPDFLPLQRLHATLETLGKIPKLHGRVFQAIHEQNLALNQETILTQWLAQQGEPVAPFMETYRSFGVQTQTTQGKRLQDQYEVEGTPAFAVQGQIYIPGQGDKTLDIVSHFIKQFS